MSDGQAVREWTPAQRLKNDAIYALVFLALLAARIAPRSWLTLGGRALGLLAWVCARATRRLAKRNMERALGDARLARRAFDELGGLLGDTIALLRRTEPVRMSFAPGARELLERARREGRGVVLITAHLGPWERLAAALVEAGFPLTTPVRASYDPRLEALLHAPLRKDRGVNAIDRDAPGTPRALVRALRAGEVAGFLIDLNTRVASVRVPFFGADAWTPSGPARLALRTGAPVVAAFATRGGIVVEEVRCAAAPASATEDDVVALTRRMTGHVERAVAREPDRWIWMHDRWGARRLPATATTKTIEPVRVHADGPG